MDSESKSIITHPNSLHLATNTCPNVAGAAGLFPVRLRKGFSGLQVARNSPCLLLDELLSVFFSRGLAEMSKFVIGSGRGFLSQVLGLETDMLRKSVDDDTFVVMMTAPFVEET